eukprot:Opistho-2@85828
MTTAMCLRSPTARGHCPSTTAAASRVPVYHDIVASKLNIQLYDFAFGGATTDNAYVQGYSGPTGELPVPSVIDQVAKYLSSSAPPPTDPSVVFTVAGGANDYFFLNEQSNVSRTIDHIFGAVRRLYTRGARRFIVPNLFPGRLLPYVQSNPQLKALFSHLMTTHNALLEASIPSLRDELLGASIDILRVEDVFLDLEATGPSKGFTEPISSMCVNLFASPAPTVCDNSKNYVFFDSYHPTTGVHAIIAQKNIELVASPMQLWRIAMKDWQENFRLWKESAVGCE